MSIIKPSIESITTDEIQEIPVWRFASKPRSNETELIPVRKLPCKNSNGYLFGTQATLADGSSVWCFIGNVDSSNPRLTEHFITISVESNSAWFHLARYHDFDFAERSPFKLAEFLGKDIDSVFPIKYDIRSLVASDSNVLVGEIKKEPTERLTRSEIVALAVP
jgi:hypothetical protein